MKNRKILYIMSLFVVCVIFSGGVIFGTEFTSFTPAKAVAEYSVIKYSIVNLLKILRVIQIALPIVLIIFALILIKNKKKKVLNIIIAIVIFVAVMFARNIIFKNNIQKVTLESNEISSYDTFEYDKETVYYLKNK